VGVLCATAAPAAAQRCAEPHYRWTEKVDTLLARPDPVPTTITAILTGWAPPDLTARDDCADRGGRERTVYAVAGWVRRVDKRKDDGDWHIELTERADSPPDSCIVVEIPSPRYGTVYAQARSSLDSLLGKRAIRKNTLVARPRRIQVSGPAFFDGQHRRGATMRIRDPHGRCNSSIRALWEIHPVYRVTGSEP
jgi:hypothetical protein